jgi:hypothetical protein
MIRARYWCVTGPRSFLAVALIASVGVVLGSQAEAATRVTQLRVVRCKTQLGAEGETAPRVPKTLPFAGPNRVAGALDFYSNGFVTVAGPRGWTCHGVEAADGGRSLSVFPRRQPDPLGTATPAAGARGVTAILEYTGHGPGAHVVCGLFPNSRAADLASQTGGCEPVPRAEQVRRPSADVARFVDPVGVHGSGDPSGGRYPAAGVVVFPRGGSEAPSVNVAKATCTGAGGSAVCDGIVDDFVTRTLPHS